MPYSCFQSYQADNHIVSVPDRFFVKDQVQLAYIGNMRRLLEINRKFWMSPVQHESLI